MKELVEHAEPQCCYSCTTTRPTKHAWAISNEHYSQWAKVIQVKLLIRDYHTFVYSRQDFKSFIDKQGLQSCRQLDI